MGDRILELIVVSFVIFTSFGECNAAIVPVLATYEVTLDSDFTVPWIFDNEADMSIVDWTYKSSSSATPTTVMSKAGTSAATVFNNYNVEHAGNGNITLKSVMMNNTGIYFCIVTYTIASTHPAVTGTATISVSSNNNDEHNTGLSVGEITGITLGCIAGIALIVAGFFVLKYVILPRIVKAENPGDSERNKESKEMVGEVTNR